jgi:hypothetical protein
MPMFGIAGPQWCVSKRLAIMPNRLRRRVALDIVASKGLRPLGHHQCYRDSLHRPGFAGASSRALWATWTEAGSTRSETYRGGVATHRHNG